MNEACRDRDSNLRGLLERLRKIRLWINSAKMRLHHEEVRYLSTQKDKTSGYSSTCPSIL